MKTINLTQGLQAFVDDEDYDKVINFKWYAKTKSNLIYAARNIRINGARKTMLMHILIANPCHGNVVDHRDSNGLNNQKNNLRVCTHEENMHNRRSQRNSSSNFKGVSKFILKAKGRPRPGRTQVTYSYTRFQAQITHHGKVYRLGSFKTEIEAAIAYNTKAKELHKEFAYLNKI